MGVPQSLIRLLRMNSLSQRQLERALARVSDALDAKRLSHSFLISTKQRECLRVSILIKIRNRDAE